jgi:mono/diheme cytochrome c family protein
MATRKSTTTGSRRFLPFLLGFLAALILLVAATWAYLHFGSLPVATADKAFPFEKEIVHIPMHARIHRELQQPPFGTSEDVYETGAHVYTEMCASCHGVPGENVPYAKYMFPVAPQLWQKHKHGNVVGVSDDEPGETYWKIKNGIRLSGMPSYQNLLSSDEMWDVALLLKNADQQLPDPVLTILTKK